MTPPENPGADPGWGEGRRAAAEAPPDPAGPRAGRPRTPEEELADLYAEQAGDSGAGGGAPPPPPRPGLDFSALFVLLDVLRRAAPSDLQDRFTSLIREALLTLRSLIDWYLDRLDHPAREPRVEDIPID